MFTLRRYFMAMNLVFLQDYLVFQIQLNFVLSLIMIIYVGKYRPWEIHFNNKLEQFNEFSCLILQYHQMVFTDFVLDIELKSTLVGSSFIYTTYAIIAVNCSLIGLEFYRQRQAAVRKRQNKARFNKHYEQVDLAFKNDQGSIFDPSNRTQDQLAIDYRKKVREHRRIQELRLR